jgi:CrcB protein
VNWTLIIVGGGIGATLRYLLGVAFAAPTPPHFPWVTFLINIVGAFILAALMTIMAAGRLRGAWAKPFLTTGLIGGFTTWSDFVVEADQLAGADRVRLAAVYLVTSIVVGFAAAAAGAGLARSMLRRGEP